MGFFQRSTQDSPSEERAAPGCRGLARPSMSHTLFITVLLFTATLMTLVVCLNPSHDPPPGYVRGPEAITEGFQQLAEARAWSEGVATRVPDQHRRPLVSLPAYAIFAGSGVSLTSVAGLAWVGMLGALWVLARLLRARLGPELAALGAFTLVMHPAWHAVARDALVMPWTGFWLLLILAVAGGRGWLPLLSAWVVLVLAALWLDPFLWVLAPGLAAELAVRLWPGATRLLARLGWPGLVFLALVVASVTWIATEGTLARALGLTASPWEFEQRTGFVAAVPFLMPMAWLGSLLFATHAIPRYGAPRSRERVLHLGTWGALAVFAVHDQGTSADLAILIPALVALAMTTLHTALRVQELRRLPPWSPRGLLLLGLGLPGTALIVDQLQEAVSSSVLAGTAFGVATAGVLTLAAFTSPLRRYVTLPRVLLPVCFLLLPLPLLVRLLPLVDGRDDSLGRASRALALMVPPDARLGGDYAHVLGVASQLTAGASEDGFASGEQLRRDVIEGGYTHLVIRRPADPTRFADVLFESELRLQWVESFHVRGEPVLLLRVVDQASPMTRYEAAMRALAEDRTDVAHGLLLEFLELAPHCGAAWSRLGQVSAIHGRHQLAYQAYLRALEHDPTRMQALVALASIYESRGLTNEAYMHLRLAQRAEPGNEALRVELERLARKLDSADAPRTDASR